MPFEGTESFFKKRSLPSAGSSSLTALSAASAQLQRPAASGSVSHLMQIYPQKLSPAMVPDRASPAGLLPIATVIVMLKTDHNDAEDVDSDANGYLSVADAVREDRMNGLAHND